MNSHLVTVEVSVKCRTYQRMKLDSLTFYQHWFECLNTKTVQGRSAVQENRMLSNYLVQNVPNIACATIYRTLCSLDVGSIFKLDQALHYEWLEQLECHLRRQTALMQLQGRTNNNYGTTRVVNTLT